MIDETIFKKIPRGAAVEVKQNILSSITNTEVYYFLELVAGGNNKKEIEVVRFKEEILDPNKISSQHIPLENISGVTQLTPFESYALS